MGRIPNPLRVPQRIVGRLLRFWGRHPFLLAGVVSVLVGSLTFTGFKSLQYMETPEFCQRCHTMEPEVVSHEDSPHSRVECAECHVGRGLTGLLKSKWAGAQQMFQVIFGTYPRPIPPAAHGMPPPEQTCLRCHDPSRQRDDVIVMRSRYMEDERNSMQRVALMVRVAGDEAQGTKGIHWHANWRVEFVPVDESARAIEWVSVENPDGTRDEYLAQDAVEITEQAGLRADQLRSSAAVRRMSCYDCHNRVGHELRTPARAIDEALSDGSIDPTVPFIKKKAMEVISAPYGSQEEAERAIYALTDFYRQEYPELFSSVAESLDRSLRTLITIYRETASPEMLASFNTYPSFLGHTDSAGCFRCHDGGHFKIVDGRLSEERIPSRCSLCHTFPLAGSRTPNLMIGEPPTNHDNPLWVFDHKSVATSVEVGETECQKCHSQTYCTDCHATGALAIDHDKMLYNHASVIRDARTSQVCTYCHQTAFCRRCHEESRER